MKKTTYFLLFLSIFLISSFSGFSQSKDANAIITLYSEDFETNSVSPTYLNDSGYTTEANMLAHSFTGTTLYLWNDPDWYTPAYCDTDEDWKIHTGSAKNGTAPAGMTNKRAGIEEDATWCYQQQSLITPTWTATRSLMTISFSYSYYPNNNDWFKIHLQSKSGAESFSNHTELVFGNSDGSLSVDFASGNIVVTPGYDYRLVFTYRGSHDYGAAVDTILVQHPTLSDLTVSADQTISDSQTYANLTVDSPRTLTIARTGKLTITTDITNNGTIVINSDEDEFGSLIYQGSSTDETITYNRYVNDVGTNEWDLIGSPVAGQVISSFVTTNDGPLTTGGGSGSDQYAIGVYDNEDDTWTNYTAATVGSAAFDIGTGYAMGTDSGATVAFTGTMSVVDFPVAITDEDDTNSGAGRIWNLVANPYPSYLNVNTKAHATNNFLTVNGTTNLHDTYVGVYGYDADGVGVEYTIYNQASASAVYIAPGQGFFVAADANVNLSFTEAMQTVIGTDDFIDDVLNDSYEVLLRLYHGNQKIAKTRLYFEDGLSLGLNPGYDAGSFDGNAALMTRLVEEDEGYGMAINAMSTEDMDDVVIPLEINQTAGQEFRINLHTSTIGEVNTYLEDTELQTLTLLNEEDFVLTPSSDLEGVGRFYVHLTANALSNEEVNTSLLNAYKEVDNNYITIEGLATQATSTQVSLFNILGVKVLDTTLDNTTNTQTISTNGFATGIYVLKLASGKNQLTKKLIIK